MSIYAYLLVKFTWSGKDALFQRQIWKFTSYESKIVAENRPFTIISPCQRGLMKGLKVHFEINFDFIICRLIPFPGQTFTTSVL